MEPTAIDQRAGHPGHPVSDGLGERGEEFREDSRRQRKRLPTNELTALTELSSARSAIAIAKTLLVTAAAVGAGLLWWSPLVVAIAIVVIASQQQALFVLAHEAAHYRLFSNRTANDWVGCALAALPGFSMRTYRVVHRLHHNDLYGKTDPDIALHGGYPRGRRYLWKKLRKDLLGMTAYKTYAYFYGSPTRNDKNIGKSMGKRIGNSTNRPLDDTSAQLRAAAQIDQRFVIGFHVALLAAAISLGALLEYLVLWILPLVTVLQAILRYRAICEHGAVIDTSSALTAARTNFAPWWLHWALFPHHVNYHIEHHLYPAIPHYNLPACHRALQSRGVLEMAEVRNIADTTQRIFADPVSAQ